MVMGDIATPTATGNSTEQVERRVGDREQGMRGRNGLYPPRNAGRSARMIGEVVVDLGFSDREAVEEAVKAAREQGRPTGIVLVERLGLDFVDLAVYDLDMGAANLI